MPNTSALVSVQDAVFDRLAADATLLTLADNTIKGFEPESPPTNFIVIGNATEMAWHTLGGKDAGWGWETTVTVHCYSYYKGDLKALQMLARVVELLNFYDLPVSGWADGSPPGGTVICEYGEKLTKVLTETKDKRERRHIPAVFTIRVHE